MTDLRHHAEEIYAQFSDSLEIEIDEIEDRLETLITEYHVPSDEAKRSVISSYLEKTGMDRTDLSGGSSQSRQVADIAQAEEWVDVKVKVVDLWEPRSDAIAQVGLVGDESGTIKFTKWAKSELPELEEGNVYQLNNVVTDEYQGQYSIKLNSSTAIESLDDMIEVGDNEVEIEGAFVDIQAGSGLIKRCPDDNCTRVLQNGRCSEHGEVEGEFDLRIKGVLDDGSSVYESIFDTDATESIAGISLEEAQEMAMDALDTEVVEEEIRRKVIGRYYRVAGPQMGRYLLANDVELLDEPTDPEEVLINARAL